MSTNQYMTGRRKYTRPQAVLFSENPGTLNLGLWVPEGFEIGGDAGETTNESLLNQFLVLSDDNRKELDFKPTRIENRRRTINGRMRSYHVADKMELSISWDMLPSRSFSGKPNFNSSGKASGISGSPVAADSQYTTDGGAGGVEILNWYNNHQGPFWVFLAYDNYREFGQEYPQTQTNNLLRYNEILEMFISDFSYSVVKRGGSNHDFWNITITLEEV